VKTSRRERLRVIVSLLAVRGTRLSRSLRSQFVSAIARGRGKDVAPRTNSSWGKRKRPATCPGACSPPGGGSCCSAS
ncbi:hypothetical protein BIW11_09807, partial [Tropilaelaps mercedesae]